MIKKTGSAEIAGPVFFMHFIFHAFYYEINYEMILI